MITVTGYGNVYVGVGLAQEPAGTWEWNSIPAHLIFKTCETGQSTPVEKMRLTSSGNLGILTTDPTATLHVQGSAKSFSYTPTGKLVPQHGIYSPSGNNVAFSTDFTTRFLINETGNVGIGTTSPSVRLHIQGTAKIEQDLSVAGNIGIGTTSPSTRLQVLGSAKIEQDLSVSGSINAKSFSITGSTVPVVGLYSPNGNDIAIATASTNRLSIAGTGDVTITGQVTIDNTASVKALIPTGATVPVRGIYSPTGNDVAVAVASAQVMLIDATGITVRGMVQTSGYTVATLPVAGVAGRRAYVTDALNPVYLSPVQGTGLIVCPVFDNGTTWIVA